MRVLIYGGRGFARPEVWSKGSSDWMLKVKEREDGMSYLQDLSIQWPDDIVVVSGGAKGADSLGEEWGYCSGLEIDRFPAAWDLYGKRAGFIRNQQMLDSGIDEAVEFPGGNGTADMRRRLEGAGIPIWKFEEYMKEIDEEVNRP